MTKLTESEAFKRGVKAAITWLHAEAASMNDPHARLVLNNAAFALGVNKPTWTERAPKGSAAISGARKASSLSSDV